MPPTKLRWRHVILNTHGTWLHGDPRGFRSRDHRIHSSGDYKNPPPEGEHARLHAYQLEQSAPPTILTADVFKPCGEAVVANASKRRHDLRAVSVNPTHVHLVVEVPDDVLIIKEIVGWMKRFATRAIRETSKAYDRCDVWAEGEGYEPIDNEGHFHNAINYVLVKQGSDAWTWSPGRGASW